MAVEAKRRSGDSGAEGRREVRALATAFVIAAAAALGVLLAAGCLIAAVFEAQGFGRERDSDPRLGHLILLALGLVGSLGIPWVLWRQLLPASAPGWIVMAVAAAGILVILGVSLA